MTLEERARRYAEIESEHARRASGNEFSEHEKELIVATYKRAWLDAIRHVETMAVYSEKGIIERIRKLRNDAEKHML